MLRFINKYSWTVCKPFCHGRGNLYNFEIPTPVWSRGKVCPFTNISSCEEQIRGDRKNEKVLANALDVINFCTKGNKNHVHLNNHQKCKFHSSSTYSAKPKGYREYQDPEKRRANILIFMTVLLAVSVTWGNYKMDMSPYDKPVQKVEKL